MEKTIRIINPLTAQAVTVKTTATTWGDLKKELQSMDVFKSMEFDDVRVFMKDSEIKKVLTYPEDSVSPESSFKLFISPSNMKGGNKERLIRAKEEIVTILDNIIEESYFEVKVEPMSNEDLKEFLELL